MYLAEVWQQLFMSFFLCFAFISVYEKMRSLKFYQKNTLNFLPIVSLVIAKYPHNGFDSIFEPIRKDQNQILRSCIWGHFHSLSVISMALVKPMVWLSDYHNCHKSDKLIRTICLGDSWDTMKYKKLLESSRNSEGMGRWCFIGHLMAWTISP